MDDQKEVQAAETAKIEQDLTMEDQPQNETMSNKRRRNEDDVGSKLDDDEEPSSSQAPANQDGQPQTGDDPSSAPTEPKISKNQQKKLRRQQAWEAAKEDRKAARKEKRHDRSARKRTEREQKVADAVAAGADPEAALKQVLEKAKPKRSKHTVPLSIILDCDFEEYMRDSELVSLAGQVVRSYSQNRQGVYRGHIAISSFGGKLKERFETVLKNTHKGWQGVVFVEGDFVAAGKQLHGLMRGPKGGKLCPSLGGESKDGDEVEEKPEAESAPAQGVPESTPSEESIVYLSADSPHTLDKLEPYTSYVIGGLVDRNREKGLCQRRAEERGIKTAKLPIGDYMQMASRQVLTTNHVVEIMSKWLETGDWGEAFMAVIPERKGGKLKDGDDQENSTELSRECV